MTNSLPSVREARRRGQAAVKISKMDGQAVVKAGRVLEVGAAQVAVLCWGRNAWHTTWISRYNGNAVIYPTVEAAKRAAEPRRRQGTVFYIREVPGIILRCEGGSALLVDLDREQPFLKWAPLGMEPLGPVRAGWPLLLLLNRFNNRRGHWAGVVPSEHRLLVGSVDEALELPPMPRSKPLRVLVSTPQGAGWPLAWTATTGSIKRKGVNTAVAALQDIVLSEAELAHDVDQDPPMVVPRQLSVRNGQIVYMTQP